MILDSSSDRSQSKIQYSKLKIILAGIMACGLLLRLVFFTASLPSGGAPFIRDEANYVGLAVPLSQGQGFVEKWPWLRAPGYPMFMAAFTALGGGNLPVAALAQILLSVANIGMAYVLAVEVFGRLPSVAGTRDRGYPLAGVGIRSAGEPVLGPRSPVRDRARTAGLMSAGLMALNPHVVFYANLFMTETLYMLALTIIAWALLRALRARGQTADSRRQKAEGSSRFLPSAYYYVALAGLAAGAAVLVRSMLLTFVPLLLAWFWWVMRARPSSLRSGPKSKVGTRRLWTLDFGLWTSVALFLVAMFAVILPWTVRNYIRYDRFLLVETTGGYNFWIYNDPNTSPDEIDRRLREIPNPVDREPYAARQGIRVITSNLPAFAKTAADRFISAWPVDRFYEFRVFLRDKYPGTDCTNLDIFAWLGTAFYIALGLLTIWGFALAPGRTFKGLFLLVLLHYLAITVTSQQEFRFRMPLYPFAGVYAGWALTAVARVKSKVQSPKSKVGPRRLWTLDFGLWTYTLLSLAFLVQCLLVALPGIADSVRYERRYLAGKRQLERADYAGTLAAFEGASAIDKACACLYRNIGLAHGGLGEADKERAAYATAISIEEHDWRTRALLSDRLRAAGDPHAPNPVVLTRPEFRAQQQRWAWEHLSPPPDSRVDIGAGDLGYVMGFESPEIEPLAGAEAVSYRWTTAHSYVRIPIPPLKQWSVVGGQCSAASGRRQPPAPDHGPLNTAGGPSPLRLVVRWHSLARPGNGADRDPADSDAAVRVLINGASAGTLVAHPGWEEACLDLPGIVKPGLAVIELLAPVARPPGGEARLLGVAVDWIGFEF